MKLIEKKLADRRARVAVMGLGYVGLPLACAFAEIFETTAFDVDASKISSLRRGVSYIPDLPSPQLKPLVDSGRLRPTADPGALRTADAVVICVPTPLRKSKDPDMSYIQSAVETLAPRLKRGQLVVLESTTYPGTTREVVKPRLEKRGLAAGKDFHLAFSPERVDPANKKFGIKNTPKIVGGITPACADLAARLYESIVDRVIRVSSAEAAEMVKLLENTFRAVNIALVNEVALMCDRLKLNAWEVVDAAATKPFGFMPFYPGPGIGGHCIPLDPQYLSWKLKTLNFHSRFIELAEEINSAMPEHVVKKVMEALNARGRALKGAKVLVLGVAYKKNVGDVRESPALAVIEQLREKGARVAYHDPHVPLVRWEKFSLRSAAYSAALLKRQDAVVILTDHADFDAAAIVGASRLVVDTRNAARGLRAPHVVRL